MSETIPGMISVIIPTYNRRGMLLELLDTIRAQDYPSVEILVVDDGSSDGTSAAMEKLPVRYFRNERNSGPGFSRKRGFQEARGEYVVFADDDDYYTDPTFYSRAADVLRADKTREIAFVAANARIQYVDRGTFAEAPLPVEGRFSAKEYLSGFSGKYPKPLSTFPAVFRRESLIGGGLEESLQVDDRVIYLRALLAGDAFILPEPVGVYRIHRSNFSATVSADFTVTLHRENKMIYDRIRRSAILPDPDRWWYEQAWIALRYYIQNPSSDLNGLLTIFRYLRRQRVSLPEDLKLFKQALAYWRGRRLTAAARRG